MNTLTIISNSVFDPIIGDYKEADDFLQVLQNPSMWTQVECDDIISAMAFFWPKLPSTAKIYFNHVSLAHDVTPRDIDGIERLRSLKGNFIVLVMPGHPAVIAIIIIIIILAAVVVMAFLFKPAAVPSPAMRSNNTMGSTNNELSERTNQPRPNGRIPDIFGKLRATPDMVCVAFTRFVNNQEVEDSVMCIGRGSYTIHDARDGDTSIYEVEGTSLQIYRPYKKINRDLPYFKIGPEIPDAAMVVYRSNSVNGQELKASNTAGWQGDHNVRFEYPNVIRLYGSGDFSDFVGDGEQVIITRAQDGGEFERTGIMRPYTEKEILLAYETDAQMALYSAADQIILYDAYFLGINNITYPLSGTYDVVAVSKVTVDSFDYIKIELFDPWNVTDVWNSIDPTKILGGTFVRHMLISSTTTLNFNGTYTVATSGSTFISLVSPHLVNANWDQIAQMENYQTNLLSPLISKTGSRWIGPFVLELPNRTHISCNFMATNGMYKDDGKKQRAASVTIETEVTPVDGSNQPIGPSAKFQTIVKGNSSDKDQKAQTLYTRTPTTGRVSVRCRRITPEDTGFEGTVVDQVKWRDLFGLSSLHEDNFGNVTMVRLRQWATAGALAMKERKLNCLVTREIPRHLVGSTFTTDLYPTSNAAEILSFVSLDPYIGARYEDEIDFNNIYQTTANVAAYFGTTQAIEFCYTFDKEDLSFEDTANTIAEAIFCTAYRRGKILQLFFERKTDRASMLFNHRNKLPGSESRTFTTGYQGDNDGVEYEYVSPIDDAAISIYIPADRSAMNPKKYESLGVRNRVQAWLHAYRFFNRLRHQYLAVEFKGTQEAFLLMLGDRVLVADNTQNTTQDGEIIAQNGLVLTLSKNIKMEKDTDYWMFLQLADGTVESIKAIPGDYEDTIILTSPPRIPLVFEDGKYARTTFMLTNKSQADIDAFLIGELDYDTNFTAKVSAVNYDDRYYQNDRDYIEDKIDEVEQVTVPGIDPGENWEWSESGTFIVPENGKYTLEIAAGEGGGNDCWECQARGGAGGYAKSINVLLIKDTHISVVIGKGGGRKQCRNTCGNTGQSSSIGAYISASGGSGGCQAGCFDGLPGMGYGGNDKNGNTGHPSWSGGDGGPGWAKIMYTGKPDE